MTYDVDYQGGDSRRNPGQAVDYMLANVGDVELYAEAPAGTMDLRDAYAEEKRTYAQSHSEFVNMSVPTEWGRHFTSENDNGEKKDLVSISIPVGEDHVYYSFVIGADHFKPSTKAEGMSYFGFPRVKKGTDEPYMVTIRHGEKKEDGTWLNKDRDISSTELKEYVDAAVEKARVNDLFVTTDVAENLVRDFERKADHKPLSSIAVPVYQEGLDKAVFYEIVVPRNMTYREEGSKKVRVSLFKNGSDGSEYTHTATHDYKDEKGEWKQVTLILTSEQVVNCFEQSKEQFLAAGKNGMTLGDALRQEAEGNSESGSTQTQAASAGSESVGGASRTESVGEAQAAYVPRKHGR